jgi:ATP-dependent Clp protease ATP-binding subunit ClpB
MKLSFVLFDEIEKASDALWNLLLGVLDKATLTLGDNRRVDFSRALIFMTSNLGASEMGSILRPNMGFAASEVQRLRDSGHVDTELKDKISKVGVEAARRKFTPEFMNRIDKTVVFRPLGQEELKKILDLELTLLQQRVFNSASAVPFGFSLTDSAKEFVLREGTDVKYGARHLKRAIERSLVHPISNLIATAQVRTGDLLKIDFDQALNRMIFFKEAEDVPAYALAQLVGATAPSHGRVAAGAEVDMPRIVAAKTSRGR